MVGSGLKVTLAAAEGLNGWRGLKFNLRFDKPPPPVVLALLLLLLLLASPVAVSVSSRGASFCAAKQADSSMAAVGNLGFTNPNKLPSEPLLSG